jgi:hypothetical protein
MQGFQDGREDAKAMAYKDLGGCAGSHLELVIIM